jgi:hypothetical protein
LSTKKLAAVKANPKVDSYSRFLSSIDPIIIALVQESFRIDRLKYLKSEHEVINARIESTLIKLGKDAFDVRSSLILKARNASEVKSLIDFLAVYELHFHGNWITESNVKRFISSELRIVIWPYFRELVNNATGRMHVPPIILPVSSRIEGKKTR